MKLNGISDLQIFFYTKKIMERMDFSFQTCSGAFRGDGSGFRSFISEMEG